MWIKPFLALFGIAALLAASPSAAQPVGTMIALQTNISGAGGKNLEVGSTISLGDELKSNRTGLGMIVFKDESSAKIGPNSTLVIDEFVYQPGRNRGSVGVNMSSGLARFYGGQISKTGKMEINTPHIVLGIRGGIIDTQVGDGFTSAILRAGRMTCTVNGLKRVVTKPGFACISDGGSLRIEKSAGNNMALLDSLDQIAGTGLPGRFGPGLGANTACISGNQDGSSLCKSTNASLPGLDVRTGPGRRIPPLGSPPDPVIPVETQTVTTVTSPTTVTTAPTIIDCSVFASVTDPSLIPPSCQ